MNFYLIEGTIINGEVMSEEIMKEHITYTSQAMAQGMIFLSGLKSDMSGGVFLVKAECLNDVQDYLDKEPLGMHGIQRYRVLPFDVHYVEEHAKEWFQQELIH